ncbi:NLR family CARD domain-containing protein 3 [Pteropus vampyrus]|uniref:NLR family CARD domain-containing protein 3 n=1 Tax=Pteropus vampyrus TaxID=132908 RepID=A0A6P3RC94_PTEVA|nr:NLR family CARD domain-containing protein 3 [Pteropus vampyrus]
MRDGRPPPPEFLRPCWRGCLGQISCPLQLLVAILDSMKKQEVLKGGEAGQGHGAGSPAEQVKALVDLLAGKGSQGSQTPQIPDRTPDSLLGPHSNDLRIQRHRDALLSRAGGSLELGGPSPRLTNLLLVEGLTDLQLREHDFTQVEATRGSWHSTKTIALDRLFLPLSRVSIPPRISITIGVAGVGKTTLVRDFIRLWARGQVGKNFSLVLPLTFRDLNTHEKLSADRLIRSVFPHVGESGLEAAAPDKVLLILDGLDECKTPLDFSNTVACTDPKKEIQVDHLITNIIRGNLFPEVSVWVTSRPSMAVNALLAGSMLAPGEHQGSRAQAAELLQGCLHPNVAVCARAVNVLHCLHELQHTELARSVEEAMESGGLAGLTGPPHRAALAYLLQVSDACAQEANLSLRLSQGVLQSLLPQLLYCRSLRLDTNQFQDPVMELLGSVLSGKDCRIQRISLAENQISNKGAKALARSLLVNRSLTTLDLRSNSIGPQGAKALADALKINRTLASLSLQSNRIRDDGSRSIAEALAANRTLSMLHLQKNTIGPTGAQRMADALKQNRSLKELMFSSNSIGDGGAKALAEALKVNQGLQSLDLQSNSISDTGVAALMGALCANRTLLSLNLRENSISPEGAQHLARALCTNSTLKNLDLTANLLHDQGAQAIAVAVRENHALTSLHLQWNFIQAGAAKALGQALQFNRSLTSLDLQENAIGDEGVCAVANALKANTALTALYLQVTSIGAPGAQALGEALSVNRTLEILDLRGNTIGVAGAKALANALKVNSSLRRLNLQENSLGMDGAICVATALSGNHGLQHINLQGNHIGESGARMISEAIKTNAPLCTVEM